MKSLLVRLLRRMAVLPPEQPVMRTIVQHWTVVREGRTVCRLVGNGEVWDMFWRGYTAHAVPGGPPEEVLFRDDYWADCNFLFRHESLALVCELVIVRASGDSHLSVRGLPELLTIDDLERASAPGAPPLVHGARPAVP